MRYRKIRPQRAYGLCRAPVVSRLGLAVSLGWVRLILDRFRDAVCTHPDSSDPLLTLKMKSSTSSRLTRSAVVVADFEMGSDGRACARAGSRFLT